MAVEAGQIYVSVDAEINSFNRKMQVVDGELGKLKRQSAIAIPVDNKQLHGLNDLIDKKIVHLGVLRKEASIPIKPLYDPTSLSAGINQVKAFRSELAGLKNEMGVGGSFNATIRHQVDSSNAQGYGILAQEFNIVGRDLGKGLQDVVKEIASLKPSMLSKALGFAGNVATAPLRFAGGVVGNFAKNIFTGFTEDIGRTLSGEFARGGTQLGSQKIKSAVAAFNREVVGQNQVYETFFSELLRSGSLGKGVEAAMPRSEIGKIQERLLKLEKVATAGTAEKQLKAINADPELKQLLVNAGKSVASEVEGFSKLNRHQKTALTVDRFLTDAQPTHLFKNIALPFINEFKGLLTFIQGMQSYRTSLESQKYYNETKAGFPILKKGEDIVNVIGGAQFKGGQGGRNVAMSVEMLAPNKRFIPVENPETDTEKLSPRPMETWFSNKIKEFFPTLSDDLADTAINLFRQATHALNPTGFSTAAAQSIANIRHAQDQGRQGSILTYSLGGAEAIRADQTMRYMGINGVNSLAMAYPFSNFTQNTSPNFKAAVAQQDAVATQLRVGAFIPNNQQKIINFSDVATPNMSNHHQKHLFKNIEFLDLFFRTINAEMPDMSPENISSIVHAGDRLYEVIGATKQLESLLKTGEFDMSSPYHRFAPKSSEGTNITVGEIISKFGEQSEILSSLSKSHSPEVKALAQELSQIFGSLRTQLADHLLSQGANLPANLEQNFAGYLKYQTDAKSINKYLELLISGKATREYAAKQVPGWEKETVPWFNRQSTFGDYKENLVEGFTYLYKAYDHYAKTGDASNVRMLDIDKFTPEVEAFFGKILDTSKLPKEEMARIDDWNVPDAFKRIQSGILAYNALVKSLKGQIPDINEFQQIGRGMSGAIALVGKGLVYKTDLDPIGASKIGSRNEVDAYNTAQGRLSPLLAKSVQGEALVVERIQGRSMKDILDRIVKPVKELRIKRDELLESLASNNNEQIRTVGNKLKSTKDEIESTQNSINTQGAEVERLKILLAGADDAQKEGIQVEIRAAKRRESDAKRRLGELRSNESRYTSELESFGNEIESVKELGDEIRKTEDKIKKEITRFNKAANILYKQVGRLGAAYHEMGIAHNDLASGNVFFTPKGITGIDFGNATVAEKGKSLPAGIKQNDQMTTYQRAVIDKDYWGILNPLSAVKAINSGYKRPLPLPEKRTFDTSLLPDTTVEPLPLGTTTPALLKQFATIPNIPTRPLQPINLGQTPTEESANPVESAFVPPTNTSQDNVVQAITKLNNDFLKWAYGHNNNPSNVNPPERSGQLVLAGRQSDDDSSLAGAMIPDPWDNGPGGAALKQSGKSAIESIQNMANVVGKVTQAVPVPAKLVAAAIAGKIAFNTMGIDAPIEHLVQSLFGQAGDVIVKSITDTVQNHTGVAVEDINQSLHSILNSMAQFQDIEPATNAAEKVVNFFKAVGNARSAATHAAIEPVINTIDAALKNGSASVQDIIESIVKVPIHQASMFAGDAANVAVDVVGGAAVGGLASGAIKRPQEPLALQAIAESPEVKFKRLIDSLGTHRKSINEQIKVINDIIDVENISSIARYAKNFIAEKQSLGGLPDQALSSKGKPVSTNQILGGWKGQFDQFINPVDILKKAHGLGAAIPDGILQALQERGHLPATVTAEMFQEMITGSKKVIKSNSPSLVFKGIGSDIVAGLDQGLDFSQVAQKVPKEMAAIIGDIEGIIKREVTQAKHSGHGLTNSLATTLETYYEWGGGNKSTHSPTQINRKDVEKISQVEPPKVGTKFERSAIIEGQKLDLHAYVSKTIGWYLSDLMVNGDFKPPKDPAIRAALRKQLDVWMQELFSVVGENPIKTSPIDARSERLWAGYGFKEMEGDEHYGKMERVGLNINKGLTAGIAGSEGEPITAIANTSKKLITTAMDVLGEKSPSKVFIKIGENVAIGYKIGIVDGIAKIQDIEMLTLPTPDVKEFDGWKNIENYKNELNKLPVTKTQSLEGESDKSNFEWLELRAKRIRQSKVFARSRYGDDLLAHYEDKDNVSSSMKLSQDELNILAGAAKEAQKAIVETVAESVKVEAKAVELPPPTVQRPTVPDPSTSSPFDHFGVPPLPPRIAPPLPGDDVWGDALALWVSEVQQQTSATRPAPARETTLPGVNLINMTGRTASGTVSPINFIGGNGQPPRNPPISPAGASPQPQKPERLIMNQYRNWQENRINGVEGAIAQAPQNADRGFWEWFNNILDEIEAGAGAAGAGVRGLGRTMGALEEKMPGLGRILENIKGFAGGLLMYMGFQQIEQVLVDFARAGIDTALQLERMKTALTYDSSINAASKLKEIAQFADEIGANALVAAQSFTKLTIAAANTTVAPQVQKIFEGFSAALVGQGATPDEQQRAFLSVQQMIGKGEILAEELRSQAAEVMPQIIGAMARSKGFTQEQLTNQMKNSKLFPETDLQPLANTLSYEATLPINTVKESPLGNIARFQNAQEKLQGRLGETILGVGKPVMDLAAGGMNALNSVATGLTATMGLLVTMLGAKFVFALLDTGTASRVVTIALKVLGLEFMTNNWLLNGLNTGLAKLSTNLVISGSSSNVAVRGLAATAGAISGVGSALLAIAPQLIAFVAIGYAIDRGTKIWQSYHGELKKTNDELEQMINNLNATNTLTGKPKNVNEVDRGDPTYTRLGGSNPTPITGVGDFAQRVLGGVLNNYTQPFGFNPSAPNSGINNIVIDIRDEKGNITSSVRMDKDERRDLMENLKQVDRGIEQSKRLVSIADANFANPANLAKGKAEISQLDREIAVIRTQLANNSKLGGNNREQFKNLSAELAVKVGKREEAVNSFFGNQIALEQMNKALEAAKMTVQKNPDTQARNAQLEAIAKAMAVNNVTLEAIRMSTGSINQKIPGLIGASQLVSSAGANIAEYNQGLASQRNNALLNARLNNGLDDIDLQRQQALDNLTSAKREYLPVKQDSETFKNFALNGLTPDVTQTALDRLELRGRGGEKYKDPLDMIMNTSAETMKALAENGTDLYPGLKEFLDNAVKFKEKYQRANELEGKVLQAQIDLEKLTQQRLNIIRQANTQIAASNTNTEMYRAASKGKIGTQDIQAFTAYNDLATAKSQLENVKALFSDNAQDPADLAKQLAAAQEAVAKAEFAVTQSGQNTEEYYRGLGQSVEDFNRSVLETEIGWQQQIRDFGWSVQDSARNAFIETRGLQEAWADLQFDLEGQLLAAQNELKSTSEKLRQTKASLAVESISFQPDSIGKKTASIFVDFLANIGNLEGEGRSLDEKQRQVGQEYVTTLRRIRDEQEKQLRAEEERTRGMIRLNEQFRSLMMQMESSSIKLGRELEQIITRITKEAPNSGYQNNVSPLPAAPLSYNPSAGIDPRYGDAVTRVPFSVPIGQPMINNVKRPVAQPTKYHAPGDVNGLNGLMGKYGGGMSLNPAAPKRVETSYQLQIPTQNILPVQPATTTPNKKMATADLITQIAKRLGANPRDLAALISFESAGSFSPDKMGGTGNNYQGWIQFSPDARKRYGVRKGQSIEQHSEATYRYLYDRLKRNGDLDEPSIKNLYKAINPSFDYGNLLYRLQKDNHWRNADRMMNLQSSVPKEWLVADASEGVSDMGSIYQINATSAARAKRIEAEKARKRQSELADPNNISRKSLEDIIKYQKELYPEAFKLDNFYESKGIKFIDRMTSKDWKKRNDAIAKQFKESQARVDAAKGTGGSNTLLNPNIKKYQTLPGYQPAQLEPQVNVQGGNVLPKVQKPFVTKYQPKAIDDYSGLQQITDQNPITVQNTSSLTNTAGQINDVKNATIELNRALNSAQKNVELLKFDNTFKYQMQSIDDTARNLGRKIQDNGIKYQELMISSKGFKTSLDEITLAGEGVSSQFRQMDRDFYDELLGLGRQIGDITESRLKITEVLAAKEAELTKNGRQATAEEQMALDVARESLKVYDKMTPVLFANYDAISKQREKAAALADTTKQATEAWLRLDKIMAAKQGFAKVQADLYKTRYDVGAQNDWGMGTLIDPSAVINARMQAAQAKVDLDKQIREGAYSPQQASEMRRFQSEISELNIKRSFVEAIPGLKEFSSGLRSAILESKGLGESLTKVKDLVLGMLLEQLTIKPLQNAIAEFVGPMLGLDSKEFYPQTIKGLGERGANVAANSIVPFDLNNTLATGQGLPDTVDLSSAFTSLTESTTNTSQAMDNNFLAGITSTDPAMVGFILGLTEATTALSAFTSVLAVGGTGSFIDTGSNIFGNLFNAGNASAGQSVADSLSGGFTGILSHAFNFAKGGPVDPLKIDNYAGGGLVEGISQAMDRERSQSGGKQPILAVLNTDEYVISANEASDYRNYQDWSNRMAKDVRNFAQGGPVSYLPNTTQTNTSEGTVNNFNQTIKIEVANTNDLGKSMSQIERDRQLSKLRAGVR